MSKKDDGDQTTRKETSSQDTAPKTEVVRLDRVRDKLQIKRQDEKAAALAAQLHQAMGWKGTPDSADKASGKKGKRKKKRT